METTYNGRRAEVLSLCRKVPASRHDDGHDGRIEAHARRVQDNPEYRREQDMAREARLPPYGMARLILAVLDEGRPLTNRNIAARLGAEPHLIFNCLTRLRRRGRVRRRKPVGGFWEYYR
jgi:hypothetical protein